MSKKLVRAMIVAVGILCTAHAGADSLTWNGGADPDHYMTNGDNWIGGIAPDFFNGCDDITFAGSTNTSPSVSAGTDQGDIVLGVNFDSGAAPFTIQDLDGFGNFLWAFNNITNNSSNTQTFSRQGAGAEHEF